MNILRNKIWCWYDIGLLKWCVFLCGMLAGAYWADAVRAHWQILLLAALLLGIRPTIVYCRTERPVLS